MLQWQWSHDLGTALPFERPFLGAVSSPLRIATLATLFMLSFVSLFLWSYVFPSAFGVVLLIVAMTAILFSVEYVIHLWWILAMYVAGVFVVEYFWAVRSSPLQDKVCGSP